MCAIQLALNSRRALKAREAWRSRARVRDRVAVALLHSSATIDNARRPASIAQLSTCSLFRKDSRLNFVRTSLIQRMLKEIVPFVDRRAKRSKISALAVFSLVRLKM